MYFWPSVTIGIPFETGSSVSVVCLRTPSGIGLASKVTPVPELEVVKSSREDFLTATGVLAVFSTYGSYITALNGDGGPTASSKAAGGFFAC